MLGLIKQHKKTLLITGSLALLLYNQLKPLCDEAHKKENLVGAPPIRGFFPNYLFSKKGLWLFTRHWLAQKPIGHVFICHGYGEHISRYEHVAEALVCCGFSVHGMDHQGHGFSEGDRAYFTSVEDLVCDYAHFVTTVTVDSLPCFLLGHSMGGLLSVFITQKLPIWRGVVLSGAALQANPALATPLKVAAAKHLSSWLPKLQLSSLPVSGLSTVKQVQTRYEHDRLTSRQGMFVRVAAELLARQPQALALAAVPGIWRSVLLVHGVEDVCCRVQGSREFCAQLACADKALVEYPGMRHEVFLEPGSALQDVCDWMRRRV